MARKIQVNTNDAIGTMVSKLNTMSNYLGDLDDLDSSFKTSQFVDSPDVGHYDDSSFVKAINHLNYSLDSMNSYLTSGTATLRVGAITGDSARFTRLSVGELIVDSATIDSSTINLLRGTSLNYATASFDSARIPNLSGLNINYDSADFSIIRATNIFGDSARIEGISGTGNFNYVNGHLSNLYVDSAGIVNASIDNFYANIANISNILSMDGVDMTDVHEFTIRDSTGAILLGGYLMSTNSALSIP